MKNIVLIIIFLMSPFARATGLDYLLNGITTPVKVDTTTPANTRPYPFTFYNNVGNQTDLATQSTLLGVKTDLDSILTNTPTLGQKTMAGSSPVVIASDQSSVPVTVGNFPATQPVSGTVTVQQPTGTNLHAVIDSGTTAVTQSTAANLNATVVGTGTFAVQAAQSGTWNINNISGTVSLPTGASTSALQTTGNTSLATIATNSSKVPIATTGSGSCITNLTTTAQTFTAPANAIGFIVQGISDNVNNLRFIVGTTATTTLGIRLEPGRDSGYVPIGANVSVIAEAGTNQIACIQWVAQ